MGEYEFRAVTEAIHEEDREMFRMPRASAPSRMGWGLGRGEGAARVGNGCHGARRPCPPARCRLQRSRVGGLGPHLKAGSTSQAFGQQAIISNGHTHKILM